MSTNVDTPGPQEDNLGAQVERMRLLPDDIVVIKLKTFVPQTVLEQIRGVAKSVITNNEVLILNPDIDIVVMGKDEV